MAEIPTLLETPTSASPPPPKRQWGPYVIFTSILALFVLAGLGTTALFKVEPVIVQAQENQTEQIQQALKPFPAVRFAFNKANGSLLLIGHLATGAEKTQLQYNLQNLQNQKFIKSIDDSGIIIDEYVWQEVNSILSKNGAWKGISIHSPTAGQFVLSGYLQTRKQAEQLSSYISLNFPYLVDLIKNQIVVEEDIVHQIEVWLQQAQLNGVTVQMSNGHVTLSGAGLSENLGAIKQIITKTKQIPGVRAVTDAVQVQAQEAGIINLSGQYRVGGSSRAGDKFTVLIGGRLLSEGDDLGGRTITKITDKTVFLEQNGTKYRIDY